MIKTVYRLAFIAIVFAVLSVGMVANAQTRTSEELMLRAELEFTRLCEKIQFFKHTDLRENEQKVKALQRKIRKLRLDAEQEIANSTGVLEGQGRLTHDNAGLLTYGRFVQTGDGDVQALIDRRVRYMAEIDAYEKSLKATIILDGLKDA